MSHTKNPRLRKLVLEKTMEIVSEVFFLTKEDLDKYIQFAYGLGNVFTAIDSIILYSAISTDSELITLDKKLKKLYKKLK
jgi:predicted nucleic acid-binding protein